MTTTKPFTMPTPNPDEIWLVRFPFSDLTSAKVRPALVVAIHKQDVVIVGIFSKIPVGGLTETWVLINDSHPDFAQTELKKTSLLRAEKIATAHESTFQRQLGSLPLDLVQQAGEALRKALRLP